MATGQVEIAVGDVVVVHRDPVVVRDRLRWPSLSKTSVGALAAAVMGLVLGLQPMHDNSLLTHLATGRLTLDRMALPLVDPYSFTAAGSDWVVQSWVPSLLYALADWVGGSTGLLVLQALTTVVLSLLVWRLTRSALSFAARVITFGVVVVSCASLWPPRPLLLGLVLFGACLVVAEEERWPAWTLVPIGWVWVNSHGTFPLLLVYLCVRIVGRRLDGELLQRHLRLLGCAAAGIAVGAVGPLGLSALTFPLHLLGRSEALQHVVEWQSPDFSKPSNLVFLALPVAAFVLPRRRRWEDLLPSAAFVVLATTGVRHIPWAALVLVPAVARALPLRASARARGPLDAAVALCLIAIAFVVGVARLSGDAYDLKAYPVAELRWMAENGLDAKTTKVAAPEFVGNYLTWRDGGLANVFFDDRYDMYPMAVITSYRTLSKGKPGWDQALDRYGVEAVLWPTDRALARLLAVDGRWEVVHKTNKWVVAVRR